MPAAPALVAPPAPAPAPFSAAVTLEDLAGLDEQLVASLVALDDILFVASDATSAEPVMPLEAQRADIDRHGVALRALLQLSRTKVDALRVLVRLGNARRRARPVAPRSRSGMRKAGAR